MSSHGRCPSCIRAGQMTINAYSDSAEPLTKEMLAPGLISQMRAKYAAAGVKLGVAALAGGVWGWVRGGTKTSLSAFRNMGIAIDEWSGRWFSCVATGESGDADGCFSPYRVGQALDWNDWIRFAEETSANIDRAVAMAWNNTPIMLAINSIRNAPDNWKKAATPSNWPWYVWAGLGVIVLSQAAQIANAFRPRRLNGLRRKR